MRSSRPRREAAHSTNRSRPQVEWLESRDLLSVSVGQAHAGIGYTGFQPPDTVGAVGPNYYVEEVNTSIAIYRKDTGAVVAGYPKGMGTFFAPLGGVLNLSDPFVFYDQLAGKFVTGILDYSGSVSRIDLAVSNTSDPTGSWTFHRYDTTNDGTANHFTDYPRFGYNREAYVISYNQFPATTGSVHVDTIAIDKNNLASSFVHVWPTTMVASPGMSPTVMHDAGANAPMWFVGTGSGANIKVLKMTNVLSSSPTTNVYTITGVPSYTAYGPSMAIRQPGASDTVQSDSRVLNAAMMGGMLVAAHTVGISGAHVAQWYEFNTTGASPTLVQAGRVNPNASTTDTYYPTIDINAAGALGMTYIESSTTENQSMWVTGRTTADASGTMEAGMSPTAVQGTARYTSSRCGDYSALSLDPSDNATFWAANQFRGSAVWNTGVVSFSLSGAVATVAAFVVNTSVDNTGTIAGNAFDVTVYAVDRNGNIVPGYRGTVTFSSQDPYGASLPGNYTFTAGDAGVHTFRGVTALYTAGVDDVTATDTANRTVTGSDNVGVTAAPAAFLYVGAPGSAAAGVPFDVYVLAVDPYFNVDTNYQGTVAWSTTDGDPNVALPANYTFQPSDQGQVVYPGGVTLITPGSQSIYAYDTVSGIVGGANVTVTSGLDAASRHRRNATLALAFPEGLPAAPIIAAANRTASASSVPGVFPPRDDAMPTASRAGADHGWVTRVSADSSETAALDFVLADWNQGLNPAEITV